MILMLLAREIPGLARVARTAGPVELAAVAGLAVLAVPGLAPALDTTLGLLAFAAVLWVTGAMPAELAHLRVWTGRAAR